MVYKKIAFVKRKCQSVLTSNFVLIKVVILFYNLKQKLKKYKMKSLIKASLLTLSIFGLQISASAAPAVNSEVATSGTAVVGYFLLLVAFIVAPAFKKSTHSSH